MIIFCDLDWTVADCRHRLLRKTGARWNIGEEFVDEQIDWATFNEPRRVLRDPVFDDAGDKLCDIVSGGDHQIIYATSREAPIIEASAQWLKNNGFPDGQLRRAHTANGGVSLHKENIFEEFREDISGQGAVMYDDDWSRELRPVAQRFGIKLIMPDYIKGKSGFWNREYLRLKAAGWQP